MAETFASLDPATGDTVATVEISDEGAVHEAVAAARQAQPGWAAREVEERLAILQAFGDQLLVDGAEVAALVTEETGKPRTEARLVELLPTLEMLSFLDKRGAKLLKDDRFRLSNALLKDRTSKVTRAPRGVVGIIAPWNYPLAIPATQCLTALFAGNSVVLKPSELTPAVGRALVDRLHAAGVPEDVLGLVQGPGEPTGRALSEAELDFLVFTGSVPTGRTVSQECAARMTPHVLELGGKDPMVVLEDAHLPLAARGAVWGAFTNAGQTCAAVERVYVHEAVAEGFLEAVVEGTEALRVGPGTDPEVDVGPLIREEAVVRCEEQIQDAEKRGARVLTGGSRLESVGPLFFQPTVLTEVTHEMLVMREETFGPLLPIQVVASEEEAVSLANDTEYGLSASVWSQDKARSEAVADRIQAGTVTVNDCLYTYAACETPWGGAKASGLGYTHGPWGLEEMTYPKHVNLSRGSRATSPWYYPYNEDLARMADQGLEFLYGSKMKGLKAAGATLRRLLGR